MYCQSEIGPFSSSSVHRTETNKKAIHILHSSYEKLGLFCYARLERDYEFIIRVGKKTSGRFNCRLLSRSFVCTEENYLTSMCARDLFVCLFLKYRLWPVVVFYIKFLVWVLQTWKIKQLVKHTISITPYFKSNKLNTESTW